MFEQFRTSSRSAPSAPRPPATPPHHSFVNAPRRRAHPADETFPLYLIERDRALRIATTRDLRSAGLEVRPFATLADFVDAFADLEPGCVILDVGALDAAGGTGTDPEQVPYPVVHCPTILIFDSLEVADAVRAMRLGASDLLVRPVALGELIAAVNRAAPRVRDQKQRVVALRDKAAVESLTPREREVMNGVILGLSNKEMARELGISPRTVEMHRARLQRRLAVSTFAELLAIAWRIRALEEG